MITQFTLTLLPPENTELNFNMSSLFHGCLMELVPADFAQHMHEMSFRPFSQFLSRCADGWRWTINTLNDYAYDNIIPRLFETDSIYLKHKAMRIRLCEPKAVNTSFDELFKENYFSENRQRRIINLAFITPTAFKHDGKYLFYPELKNIFYSLIAKYDSVSETTAINDENLLENILQRTEIIGYNLKSGFFQLESIKIPSFTGKITIKINGGEAMASLINMLLAFSRYSGVGIKNAIGMGAASIF